MSVSNTPERYRFTDVNAIELAEYAFNLIDDLMDADDAIYALLSKIGSMFELDNVVVKEIVEEGRAVKCTYEWSKDTKNSLLGLERRFVEKILNEWQERYNGNDDGVYVYNKGEGRLRTKIIKGLKVMSLLEIPLYHGSEMIGCIDFTSYTSRRKWNCDEIASLKNVCRIMTSYLFNMRTADDIKEELAKLVSNDSVTNLPQYDSFIDLSKEGIRQNENTSFAVVCSDITDFKYINEKYGYETGDDILRLFAHNIYECFDRTVSCCRRYSDNFVMVIKFAGDETEEAIRYRIDMSSLTFLSKLGKIIPNDKAVVNNGIYIMREGDNDIDTAISNANFARKEARNHFDPENSRSVIFKSEMLREAKREIELIAKMESALDNNEFKVYLQPKVNCEDYEIVGAEALIRWEKSDGTIIYPDEFIPAFEKDGCIVKTDYFVYDAVFKYIHERLEKGLKVVPISMNVSRVHLFGRAFVSCIELLMSKYHVPTQYLEFELTENIYIEDLPAIMYTIEKLKSLNIRIAIDDFGSGYSSLDILTRLPIDVLKLDKVFMQENLDGSNRIIISCIVDMARKLGMQVLCEGVENEEQRQFLIESCCTQMQGYLFSKPIPMAEFGKMLEAC